jgi:hypothetical protein
MRNVSEEKSCRGNQKIHFMFNYFVSPFPENPTVHEMWKNMVVADRPQMTI